MIDSADKLTAETIAGLDIAELANSVELTYDIADKAERTRLQLMILSRSRELDCQKMVQTVIDSCEQDERNIPDIQKPIELERDKNGKPLNSIENFLRIMGESRFYRDIRYNALTNRAEITANGHIKAWDDTDLAASARYIEQNYGLYNTRKHTEALALFFRSREYNPIVDIVDALEWDGENRCEHFLTRWMKAEDSEYTREISRLIFAGGINRLYTPGCKCEDVPILIGTKQGEGKSTIVRWLAMHDSYFGEATTVEGNAAVEQLDGVWICEIAEILALTRAKDQEAVKSFISRQRDKVRRPYDRYPQEYPRRCIFIVTTNDEQFLRDKTGNRRFYPVKVYSSGYELYEQESECREYIMQCWAEAKARYDKGEMPCYADARLIEQYRAAQEEAMEDDWRIGMIGKFLEEQDAGDVVCVKQLMVEALYPNSNYPPNPTPKESKEIGRIMKQFSDWEKVGAIRTKDYGIQKCWCKTGGEGPFGSDELPF